MEYDELEKIKNKIEVKRTIIIIWIFIDLIIIVGIIFASATNPGSVIKTPGSKMSQQEKDIYNANIKPYINNGVKGSEIKKLIDTIISQNQSNVGKEGKFIGLAVEGKIENYGNANDLKNACEIASCYKFDDNATIDDGENNETNVKSATEQMQKLKEQINNKKKYNVDAQMVQGIYTWIIISEQK